MGEAGQMGVVGWMGEVERESSILFVEPVPRGHLRRTIVMISWEQGVEMAALNPLELGRLMGKVMEGG
jgi:hypothetical protein